MRIGGAHSALPPSQTGRADFRHPALRSAGVADGLGLGPLAVTGRWLGGPSPHRRAQPYGTTSAFARWPSLGLWHYLLTSLRSKVITRFFAATDALTPTDGRCSQGGAEGEFPHTWMLSGQDSLYSPLAFLGNTGPVIRAERDCREVPVVLQIAGRVCIPAVTHGNGVGTKDVAPGFQQPCSLRAGQRSELLPVGSQTFQNLQCGGDLGGSG